MYTKKNQFRQAIKAFRTIHLVDRCLILIMAILLFQSTYSLFHFETNTPENSNIDVMVRTSSAAIFGYFVSGNFIKSRSLSLRTEKTKPSAPILPTETIVPSVPQSRIGFQAETAQDEKPELGRAEADAVTTHPICSRLQIIVITTVGIISLCVLLLYRNMAHTTIATVGTLTQLRDFVSGCVGFLIGCETSPARDQ